MPRLSTCRRTKALLQRWAMARLGPPPRTAGCSPRRHWPSRLRAAAAAGWSDGAAVLAGAGVEVEAEAAEAERAAMSTCIAH